MVKTINFEAVDREYLRKRKEIFEIYVDFG